MSIWSVIYCVAISVALRFVIKDTALYLITCAAAGVLGGIVSGLSHEE